MATKVNLDALIRREDFETIDKTDVSTQILTLQIRDLEEDAFLYLRLRKPDFQRETSEWDGDKIKGFICSFLEGELIPAIIFWDSGSYLFVIDGAHRLSALAAWINDDYGDGKISQSFFQYSIPEEQIKVAQKTRESINKTIGSYKEHKVASKDPSSSRPEVVERAKRLGSFAIQLQWVKGDANKAETSFFRINQQAAPIDKTELLLIKSRDQPNGIAARAIIRSGTGHKYWSKFDEETQRIIEEIAKEINGLLFKPALVIPIKTLDIPVAGSVYASNALLLVFDLVNLANGIRTEKEQKIDLDLNGQKTIKFLKKCRKIVYRISGTHASSLGLHPALYFYSPTGRYRLGCFLAAVLLIQELEKRNDYKTFTEHRASFENFWLSNRNLISQVIQKKRDRSRISKTLKDLYLIIIDCLQHEKDIIETLRGDKQFAFLKSDNDIEQTETRKKFSRNVKSAAYLRDALSNCLCCQICQGIISFKSISIDHRVRKEDGGLGTIDNAQLTHPYCNTTYKN